MRSLSGDKQATRCQGDKESQLLKQTATTSNVVCVVSGVALNDTRAHLAHDAYRRSQRGSGRLGPCNGSVKMFTGVLAM